MATGTGRGPRSCAMRRIPNGKWELRWREPVTGQRPKRTVRDRDTARALRLDIEAALARGQSPLQWLEERAATQGPTLADVADAYLVDRARLVRPRTYNVDLAVLNAFVRWAEDTGYGDVRHLSRAVIAEWWAWLQRPHDSHTGIGTRTVTCSEGTANSHALRVSRMWRWADAPDRFAAKVPRWSEFQVREPSPAPRRPAPTWAEMDAAVLQARGWHQRLLMVMRCTGLRHSQACRLLWSDVDLDHGLLSIRGELGKSRLERRGRVVPLAPALLAELQTWGQRDGLLVPSGGKGRALNTALSTAWRNAGVRPEVWAKVDPWRKGQPAYAMRHGFITGLASAGVSFEIRSMLTGHTVGSHNVDTYTWDGGLMDLMREAVAHVPPVGASGSLSPLRKVAP